MYPPFVFVKKNEFIVVMVLTLVMTSLLPMLYDVSMINCFSVLVLLRQQVTHNKAICEGKHVNMTSKRAFFQKVKVLLNS